MQICGLLQNASVHVSAAKWLPMTWRRVTNMHAWCQPLWSGRKCFVLTCLVSDAGKECNLFASTVQQVPKTAPICLFLCFHSFSYQKESFFPIIKLTRNENVKSQWKVKRWKTSETELCACSETLSLTYFLNACKTQKEDVKQCPTCTIYTYNTYNMYNISASQQCCYTHVILLLHWNYLSSKFHLWLRLWLDACITQSHQ